MKIGFDLAKCARNIVERGIDFADAEIVFKGRTLTLVDDRFDYGEERFQTYGLLHGRLVIVVWTPLAVCGTSFR